MSQVYYRWRKANEQLWRRDEDQHASVRLLLNEMPADYSSKEYRKDNVRGFGIFSRATMQRLSPVTKELSMDATCHTRH